MIIAETEVADWAGEADVIVVGYGIAGACAALEAREAGGTVLVLERSSGCAGSTMASSGMLYLGGGTAVQKACGFDDTPEALAAYLTATTAEPDADKIEAFARGSAAHFDWVEAHGVPFQRSYYPEKNLVPPGPDCLMFSGDELVWPYREQVPPAPRGHKVAFDGLDGGGSLVLGKLVEHAEKIGVDARFDMHVDALVMDGDRVTGVRARHFREHLFFRARRGVALTGGGFGRNEEMMRRHCPDFLKATVVGGQYDDGTAINLGIAAGAATAHMDGMLITASIYPPEQLLKGIMVNSDGRRFVAEDSYHSTSSIAIAEQPDGIAYLILDSETFAYPAWYEHANQELVDGFETIAEMEARLGIPEGALQTTMADYDRHAAAGEDSAFHKDPKWLKPLDAGPWAAFDLSWGKAIYYGYTLGGLKISAAGEVLKPDGDPVPGLYAAGASASTLAHDSRSSHSGIALAAGSFFGRQAGRHAMTGGSR